MKTVKYLFLAAAMTLAACSNDENEVNNGPVEARITAGFGAMSRAVNTDNTWAKNNEIGVMVTKVEQSGGSGTTSGMVDRYKNVEYTTKQGGSSATFEAEPGKGIFFQDATETVTFAAYYPYKESTNASTLPTITVNTKDNNIDANQAKIDFLFASGATASKSSPTVEFKDNSSVSGGTNCQFLHKMAQLKLVIVGSTADGFTADEAKAVCANGSTYKLGGLIHDGTFTLSVSAGTATGTAATTGTTTVSEWEITGCVKADNESAYTRTYTLVLLPQDCSSSALNFQATIGGQTYTNNKDIKPNLQAGNTYTYTITAKKKGLEVSGCTIGPWTPSTGGSGDATM